jgi:hypothetical protein
MHPELESLLKLLEAYLEGNPRDADALYEAYEIKIREHSSKCGVAAEMLDLVVRKKYPQWIRAKTKPSSIPPKA